MHDRLYHGCMSIVESLEEAQEALESPLSRMADYIIEDITTQSCVHLKLVSDTPRLYRRTNREVSDLINDVARFKQRCNLTEGHLF